MASEKPSITGYLSMSRDVARFENHLMTNAGSLYYASHLGFELDYWMNPDIKFDPQSLNIWIINQAMLREIVIINSSISIIDNKLNLSYTLASAYEQSNNYIFGG